MYFPTNSSLCSSGINSLIEFVTLVISNLSIDQSWEGTGENNDIEIYTDENKTDTFIIGTFNVAIGSDIGDKESYIEAKNIIFYDKNCKDPITPNSSNFNYCYPYENPDNMILLPGTTLNNILVPVNQKTFDVIEAHNQDGSLYFVPLIHPILDEYDYLKEERTKKIKL